MKLLLENWRKYIEEDALEEGLLDFFKKKEEEGEEVVPPIPAAYIKSLRSARSRRLGSPRDITGETNVPYINWLHNKHGPWMRELELSADNETLSLKTAQSIADRLLSVEWRTHQHPINQEAIDKARERIKSDFKQLFVRLGAQQGGLSVLPPEEGEGALSYADSEGGLSMTEQWRKYITEDWRETSWTSLDGETRTIGDVSDYLGDKTTDIKVSDITDQIPSLFKDEYLQDPDNRKRIETASLDYPIIIQKSGGEYKSILDGNHRLQKAIEDEEVESIKAKILDLDNPETPEVFQRVFGGAE